MNILGIHGGVTINQHDAGAALIRDGELICCVEEERLLRVKSPRGVHNQSDAVNIPVYAEQYLHRILLSVRPIGYLE